MNPNNETPHVPEQSCQEAQRFFHDIKIEFLIHELKSPVAMVETAVRSLLEAAEIYGELNPKQEKVLQRALRNTEKLRCMVYELLEVGRSEAECFFCQRFNPAQVARQVVAETVEYAFYRTSKNSLPSDVAPTDDWARYDIRMDIAAEADAITINQDEMKFRQIVSNLVKNALHYRRKWMEIHISVGGDMLMLKVIDDGPGVATEHHQAIFRPYTQVEGAGNPSRRGHGLGLAGARVVARCLGGDIRIESLKGHGTAFIVELPLNLPDVAGPPSAGTSPTGTSPD
jgi:two-component system, OmpR family, sensor kinase